jgi:alcohol dehydrogenase (cytochrome c)
VTAREEGMVFFLQDLGAYRPGQFFMNGMHRTVAGERPRGVIRALDAWTGEKRLEFPLHAASWSGLLSTGGDLLFGGTGAEEGYFYALDSATGKPLWDVAAGGQVRAAPVTFQVGGKQHVAVAAGQTLIAFTLP